MRKEQKHEFLSSTTYSKSEYSKNREFIKLVIKHFCFPCTKKSSSSVGIFRSSWSGTMFLSPLQRATKRRGNSYWPTRESWSTRKTVRFRLTSCSSISKKPNSKHPKSIASKATATSKKYYMKHSFFNTNKRPTWKFFSISNKWRSTYPTGKQWQVASNQHITLLLKMNSSFKSCAFNKLSRHRNWRSFWRRIGLRKSNHFWKDSI